MHLHSMITAFFVPCLDSTIPLFAITEFSRPKLVSVDEQAGLSLDWSQTPKTGFVVTWFIYEPPHDKTNKLTCAPSENSDQPRHMRSKGSQGPKQGPNLSSLGH